jgi:hypothetical protein
MNYMAYTTRPTVVQIPGTDFWKVASWTQLGLVRDLEDAKARFGGSPVLERVKS